MKQYEQIFRNKLANHRGAEASPEQIQEFDAFLRGQRKRDRRRLGWMLFIGLGIISLGFAAWLALAQGEEPVGTESPGGSRTTTTIDQPGPAVASNDVKQSMRTPESKVLARPSGLQGPVETTKSSGVIADASVLAAGNATGSHTLPGDVILKAATTRVGESGTTGLPTEEVEPAANDGVTTEVNPVNAEVSRSSLLIAEISTRDVLEADLSRRAIGPAVDPLLSTVSPWDFGLATAWFATASNGPTQEKGSALAIGGYLSKHFGNRFILRLDGGFTFLDDGFTFRKESVSTTFGFTQRSQANTLVADRLYAWYGAVTAGYRFGQHRIETGMAGTWIYGVKGDLSKTEFVDQQPATVTALQDVWLNSRGLNRLLVDALVGYRLQINSELSVAAHMRIPLQSLAAASESQSYQFRTAGYRMTPQLSISYAISKGGI